jgi:hypothetical protein
MTIHSYWPSACPKCRIKVRCTPSDYRRIRRWEHEKVLDAMQRRLDRTPEASKLRRQTAEHPFATLKAWLGATHFLTKNAPEGQNGDELARARLQPEACDEDRWDASADPGLLPPPLLYRWTDTPNAAFSHSLGQESLLAQIRCFSR